MKNSSPSTLETDVQRYQKETTSLIKLATPVLIAAIAQTGMGFIDTIMAGGVSATDMAAVAVAGSIWLPSILFGLGLLMALVPIVAQLNGSGQQEKIAYQVQQSSFLALFISIPILLVLFQAQQIVAFMNLEPQLAEKVLGYMNAIMFSVPAYLLFQVLRNFADGLSLTKPAMVISFVGLLVNIPLNWIFVYGRLGAPALGGVGCGVATATIYIVMFLLMLFYIATSERIKPLRPFAQFYKPHWETQKRLFKLGFPVAAALFFEVTLFAVVALLVAPFGSQVVAAHQVALNFASFVFVLPMSVGVALSIRVGYKLGEQDIEGAIISSHVGLMLGLIMSICTATLTVIFREEIAILYTNDKVVITIAMQLLLFAAVYQCVDAIQLVATGALRGYKDMKAIFVCTLISYWFFGLPIGYILAITDWITEPMGVDGFWIGFIIGLFTAAIMFSFRLCWMHRQTHDKQLSFAMR